MKTKTRKKSKRKTVQYWVFHRGPDVNDFQWIMVWFACTVPFCAVTLALVWLIHEWGLLGLGRDNMQALRDNMQALEVFVSVFGLAYAVVVGLLIVEAHGRWHSLSSALRSELNALSDIYDCLHFFDDDENNAKAKKNICAELIRYVDRLKELEWELMSHTRGGSWAMQLYMERPLWKDKWMENKEKFEYYEMSYEMYGVTKYSRMSSFWTPGINEIIEGVKKLKSAPEGTPYAEDKIVDKICDLTSYRADRIELAEGGLKGYLKFFLIFMSLIIVAGTIFLYLSERWLHMFMVGATTAGVVGLYMVLIDVDSPFNYFWKIDKRVLDAIRDKLNGGAPTT